MKEKSLLNDGLLAIGAAHYLACTVMIVQTRNQPYVWAVLALAGILSLVSGYVLIRKRGAGFYKETVNVIPLGLFGCCVILIPLILLLKGGN